MAAKRKLNLRTATIEQLKKALEPFVDQAEYKQALEEYEANKQRIEALRAANPCNYYCNPMEPDLFEYLSDGGVLDEGGLEQDDFPAACGMNVLFNFPYGKLSECGRLQVALCVKRILEDVKLGLQVLSLTDEQQGSIAVVRELGWQQLAAFNNPNTNRNCYLFGFVQRAVRRRTKKQKVDAVA